MAGGTPRRRLRFPPASTLSPRVGLRLVHRAGAGWVVVCCGLLAQALAGLPPTAPSPALAAAAAGMALWASALPIAVVAYRRRPRGAPHPPTPGRAARQ